MPLWRGWGSFCPVAGPGGLLRERQHPAVPDPPGQPDRPAITFVGRGRLMERPQSVYTKRYIGSKDLQFEQSPSGADRGGSSAPRGLPPGGQRVQPVHQRAAVRLPLLAGDSTLPPSSAGGEPQLHRHDPRGPGRLRRAASRWLDETRCCIPGGQAVPPLRLHRGGRLQSGRVSGGAGGRQGRGHPDRPGRRDPAGRRGHSGHPAPLRGKVHPHRGRASSSSKRRSTARTSTLPTAPTLAPC